MNDPLGRVNIDGFYRRFIEGFSKISRPLSNIFTNGIFDDDCIEAFETLNTSM